MDLVKALASIDAHTQALLTHSATMEKFMLVAANGTTGATPTGEAPKRGRPTAAEAAAKLAAATPAAAVVASAAPAAATPVAAVVQTAAAATQQSATAAVSGPLTHQALKDLFTAFARANGRDKLVALLGEFGAVEFGKVKVEDLPLFRDRLLGKPQTPVDPNDVGNLLGL